VKASEAFDLTLGSPRPERSALAAFRARLAPRPASDIATNPRTDGAAVLRRVFKHPRRTSLAAAAPPPPAPRPSDGSSAVD
jgi:hypothetical protein